METTKDKIIRALLTPLSYLYGGVVWVRNKLFDSGLIKEVSFDIPVVGVGNITIGGTGKTPHVEYIVDMLAGQYNIGVLSRGYKRRTKGFVIANNNSTPEIIGDEPMQIFNKYGSRVKVAVCESRRKGINLLLETFPKLDLIILDDSFQHRWVKPKISILLMDYHRLITRDNLLPLGRLRESAHERYRAENIIVTKCPIDLPPIQYRMITKELGLLSFQNLYFSTYHYGHLSPVFIDDSPYQVNLSGLSRNDSALLIAGIANPRDFIRYFKQYDVRTEVMHYPDHHAFGRKDIDYISQRFKEMKGLKKLIITTEKDAVRLMYNPYYPQELKPFTFYLPIEVEMLPGIENKDFINDLKQAIDKKESVIG